VLGNDVPGASGGDETGVDGVGHVTSVGFACGGVAGTRTQDLTDYESAALTG
jgi:hypothetical protein